MLDINDYNLDSISPISAAKYSCFGMAGIFAGRKALQLTAFISFKAAGKVAATFNKTELAQKLDNNSTYYLGLTKKNLVRDLTIAGGLLAEGLYLSGYISQQENPAPEINDPIPEPAKNETEPVVNNNEPADPSSNNETIVPNNSTLPPVSDEEPAPVVPDLPSQPEFSYCPYLYTPVCDAASPYVNYGIEAARPYVSSALEIIEKHGNEVRDPKKVTLYTDSPVRDLANVWETAKPYVSSTASSGWETVTSYFNEARQNVIPSELSNVVSTIFFSILPLPFIVKGAFSVSERILLPLEYTGNI